jgi:uncharacterized protein YndB with AHSA1/START domain
MSAAAEAIDHGRQGRTEGNLREAREFYGEAARLYREQNNSLAYAHSIRHIADIPVLCLKYFDITPALLRIKPRFRETALFPMADHAKSVFRALADPTRRAILGFSSRMTQLEGWDGVIECKVLALDPIRRLAYSWSAFGHESGVEFTLTPAEGGTHLRTEHSGFGANQEAAYQGSQHGWRRFLGNLERQLYEVVQ